MVKDVVETDEPPGQSKSDQIDELHGDDKIKSAALHTFVQIDHPSQTTRMQEENQMDATGIEHIDRLYRYALVLTHSSFEAEDLVQETYARAVQAKYSLRENSNIRAWLFTILRNVWFNHLKRRRTEPQTIQSDVCDDLADRITDPSMNPHDTYVSKITAESVREAIQKLPITFREIIVLREYEELSYQEIAIMAGCPVGTVMSRLARARKHLRTILSTSFVSSRPK